MCTWLTCGHSCMADPLAAAQACRLWQRRASRSLRVGVMRKSSVREIKLMQCMLLLLPSDTTLDETVTIG